MTRKELQAELDNFYTQRDQKVKEIATIDGAIQILHYVFDHTEVEAEVIDATPQGAD